MDEKEIKIKVGDTVIYRDGLRGTIVKAFPNNKFERAHIIAEVACEDEYVRHISIYQANQNFPDFYRIGNIVYGNKLTESYLEARIQSCDIGIEDLKKQKKQLRKQLWILHEEMVEDWKERKQARMNKKENQTTDKDTED